MYICKYVYIHICKYICKIYTLSRAKDHLDICLLLETLFIRFPSMLKLFLIQKRKEKTLWLTIPFAGIKTLVGE